MIPRPCPALSSTLLEPALRFVEFLPKRSETHHELVNLPEAAECIIRRYEFVARRKSVELTASVAPDALVVGNSATLHDALRKLIAAVVLNVCGDGAKDSSRFDPAPASSITCAAFDRIEDIVRQGGKLEISGRPRDGFAWRIRLPVSV